ncbi:MAG: 3-alpha domain-containing protein [Nodosilinea sp.]
MRWSETSPVGHRPFPQWTVARAHQIMHHDLNDKAAAAELAQCPLLSDNWREKLRQRDLTA